MSGLSEMWGARAENGDPEAQFQLGYCYELGHGTKRNIDLAAKWYLRAAEQGHGRAQYHIGLAFSNGIGVPWDLAQACKWLILAAQHKIPGAGEALNLLKVPAEVRTQGVQLAKTFTIKEEPRHSQPKQQHSTSPSIPSENTKHKQMDFGL